MIVEAIPVFQFPKEHAPRPLTDYEQQAYQLIGSDFEDKVIRDETIRLLNNEYDGTLGRLREKVHRFVGVPAMAEAITYARTGSYSPEYPTTAYVFAPIVTKIPDTQFYPSVRVEAPLNLVFLDFAFHQREQEKKKKK